MPAETRDHATRDADIRARAYRTATVRALAAEYGLTTARVRQIAPKRQPTPRTCDAHPGPTHERCGKPALFSYPAMRGGLAYVCGLHNKPHATYSKRIASGPSKSAARRATPTGERTA